MYLFTGKNASEFDSFLLEEKNYTIDILIEHAAMAVCRECEKTNHRTVYIFAGRGNNGLDAYSCGRILKSRGYEVKIFDVSTKNMNDYMPLQKKICINSGIKIYGAKDFVPEADLLIIDGIFGTSFDLKRGMEKYYENIIDKINESSELGSTVYSIDIPSGLSPDTGMVHSSCVIAHKTITFVFPKAGMLIYPGRKYTGDIITSGIGIPEEITYNFAKDRIKCYMTCPEFAKKSLQKRKTEGHKGIYGKISIAGGSSNMAGAVCLCALSASKSGAGYVYINVPESIYSACLKAMPDALISGGFSGAGENTDILALGPGADEKDPEFINLLDKAISEINKIVIDAGALNIISSDINYYVKLFKMRNERGLLPAVLTPHPGEMKRLMGDKFSECRIETAKNAAKLYNSIIVYKGAGTIICDAKEKTYINTTGNSALSRAGSGDVLTGIISALYASGEQGVENAALACYIHGLAGDIAAESMSEYATGIGDIINFVPEAFKQIIKEI